MLIFRVSSNWHQISGPQFVFSEGKTYYLKYIIEQLEHVAMKTRAKQTILLQTYVSKKIIFLLRVSVIKPASQNLHYKLKCGHLCKVAAFVNLTMLKPQPFAFSLKALYRTCFWPHIFCISVKIPCSVSPLDNCQTWPFSILKLLCGRNIATELMVTGRTLLKREKRRKKCKLGSAIITT